MKTLKLKTHRHKIPVPKLQVILLTWIFYEMYLKEKAEKCDWILSDISFLQFCD